MISPSSPLQRAQETYRLAGLRQPVEPYPALMEWDYGYLEGRKTVDIRNEFPDWSIWTGPLPNGKAWSRWVGARARAVLARCGQSRSVLFARGHILRVLAACWLGLTPRRAPFRPFHRLAQRAGLGAPDPHAQQLESSAHLKCKGNGPDS